MRRFERLQLCDLCRGLSCNVFIDYNSAFYVLDCRVAILNDYNCAISIADYRVSHTKNKNVRSEHRTMLQRFERIQQCVLESELSRRYFNIYICAFYTVDYCLSN